MLVSDTMDTLQGVQNVRLRFGSEDGLTKGTEARLSRNGPSRPVLFVGAVSFLFDV